MTEGERKIAALLAQAQMDRDATQPSMASPLAVELTRPVHQFYMNPADYADEPQSAVGKMVDDYRAHKRDDIPAMVASGVANVASMPLRMMTLEGMAGLAKDAGRIAQVPYNVLTSPEPVSTSQMVQPAADMAMMAPLGGVAAGKVAPAGKAAYSNSKEGALPGLLSAGEQQGITAYHGASSAYKDDVYNPRKSQYRAFFAAESPDLANSFARSYGDSPRVYPVTISDTAKIFDPKGNPAHGQMLAEAIDANPGLVAGSLMGKDTIRRLATEGDGGIMEMSGVQQWLKRKGFDGWKFEDSAANPGIENRASYGMLKPGHVKSSITGETIFSNPDEAALPGLLRSASAGEQMQQPGITAYHGSPHDFDRFSMDKINTGEGSQAFGHGLYFAENEGVAKSYRDGLAGATFDRPLNLTDPADLAADTLTKVGLGTPQSVDRAIARLEEIKAGGKRMVPATAEQRAQLSDWLALHDAAIEKLRTGTHTPFVQNGHMYEVRINADPSDFLDWDKPLSQQSEKVKSVAHAARNSFTVADESPGLNIWAVRDNKGQIRTSFNTKREADAYVDKILIEGFRSPEASAALRDAGIPGIKYLDQGSRTAGEGSRNFVLFRDDIVEIVKKYGWAAAAPLLAQMMMQGQDPEPQN